LLRAAVPGGAQVLALDEIHRQVDLARHLSRIEHGHQVAVRQADDDLGLVAEALQVLLVGEVREHRLDDAKFRAVLRTGQREIQRAHAAASQRLEQHVGSEAARELVHVSLPLRGQAVWCRAQTGRGPKGVILHGGSYQLSTPELVYEPSARGSAQAVVLTCSGQALARAATFRHDGRTSWRRGTYS